MSILIRGGRVVTAADDYVADVFVEGERVALIGADLDVAADRTIDAVGKYVLPGCIDPHTHLDMPFGGTVTIDDFESGQGSAACGGTTCHVDFCIQGKGQTFAEALEGWHAKANGKTLIDYGFHIAVTDLDEGGTLEELATLPEQGVTSYKLFMAYKGVLQVDDETLFRAMQVAAASGALVMVHAENGDAIDVLVHEALSRGYTEPIHHALTRPPELEGEATNRAIQLARIAGSPLYVVHVTCREAVEPIRRAREQGWDVWGETCTQYFFRSIDDLAQPGFEGAKYVYSPPARDAANHDVLWDAVRTDALSAISTDHCAFLWDGQKTLGKDDFTKIPNGGPGLEDRLKMIHHFGVREGRISLNRMVDLLATQPRGCSASIRARGRSPSAPTPISSSSTPSGGRRSRRPRTTRSATTASTRAPRSSALPRPCSCGATSSSRTANSSARRAWAASCAGRSSASRSRRAARPSALSAPSRAFFTSDEQKLRYRRASRGVRHRSASRAVGAACGFGHRADRARLGGRFRRCDAARQGRRRLQLERGDRLDEGREGGLPLRVRQGDRGHVLQRQDVPDEPQRERGRRSRVRRLPLRAPGRQEPGRRDRERDQAGQPLPRRRRAAAGRAAAGARPREDRRHVQAAPARVDPRLARPESTRASASSRSSTPRRSSGRGTSATRPRRPPPAPVSGSRTGRRAPSRSFPRRTGPATAGSSGSGRTAPRCRGSSTAPTATG